MVIESTGLTTFADESQSSRLARKSREAPFMPIGMYKCMNDKDF